MGEAKRRRIAGSIAVPVPIDLQRDIATVVRSSTLVLVGGTCIFRALLGLVIMRAIGLPAQRQIGSMLYRAGPDPLRDVVAFCGPNSVGVMRSDGIFLGHSWLVSEGDLIDFSSGDWIAESTATAALKDRMMRAKGRPTMPPIQFDAALPGYIWQKAEPLTSAWKRTGEPDVGGLWYGPLDMRNGPPEPVGKEIVATVEWAAKSKREMLGDLRLVERVAAWRRGR